MGTDSAQMPPATPTPTPTPPPPQEGQLLTNPPPELAVYAPSDLLGLVSDSQVAQQLLNLALQPVCTVAVYQISYNTVGGQSEATTASGALMVPSGSNPACQGARPIVEYAHGTNSNKNFNIAALTASGDDEGILLAAVFASQGYIVVAPNYAGYDTSTLSYHPYLVAAQQSKDMIDALTAARSALPVAAAPTVTDNHKLFVTGYSQGGFVALATHRALEAAGQTITASAPMSGPYALAAFGDAIFEGQVNLSATGNFVAVSNAYQHTYGNVWTNPTDVFEQQYATSVVDLLPSTTPISTLYAQGALPENAIFSPTPPAPQYASMTPATMPANLAPAFAQGFGTPNLVTNNYRLAYLQDAQTNPDGGFPNTTSGVPAAMPANTLRQDLKTNDLRNFAPVAPTLLCGGNSDPTVFFFNTLLMQGYWAAHAPTAPVTYLDVDSSPVANDPYATLKNAFAAAKTAATAAAIAGGATDGGVLEVLEKYHAGLVPPFCLSAAKSFFDGH
jgi:hypothetical protein